MLEYNEIQVRLQVVDDITVHYPRNPIIPAAAPHLRRHVRRVSNVLTYKQLAYYY